MNYHELASEVAKLFEAAKLLGKKETFRNAAGQVLRRHNITENWTLHMSEIGKLLGSRKKRKQKFPRMSREDILADISKRMVLEDASVVAGERHDKLVLDL